MSELASLYIRVPQERIGTVKDILEAYDGLAVPTTIDRASGLLVIKYHHNCHGELVDILGNLAWLTCSGSYSCI